MREHEISLYTLSFEVFVLGEERADRGHHLPLGLQGGPGRQELPLGVGWGWRLTTRSAERLGTNSCRWLFWVDDLGCFGDWWLDGETRIRKQRGDVKKRVMHW